MKKRFSPCCPFVSGIHFRLILLPTNQQYGVFLFHFLHGITMMIRFFSDDPCLPHFNTCLYNGTCSRDYFTAEVTCECVYEWLGPRCQYRKCLSHKSLTNCPQTMWNVAWQPLLGMLSEYSVSMMTSSNGNIFRITGPLCGEFTGHRWIPLTKASDVEFWCFIRSAPEQIVE